MWVVYSPPPSSLYHPILLNIRVRYVPDAYTVGSMREKRRGRLKSREGEWGGGRGFDGSIKRKKWKEKRNPPFPSFLSSPSTLMWNGAIPTSAQVVDCRRRGSVASSWSSAFSTFAFHPDISTFYFFFPCFFLQTTTIHPRVRHRKKKKNFR